MIPTPDKYRLIDTHCHLDLFPNAADIIADVEREQVCTIAVTNAPFLFPHTQEVCKKSDLLLPALGMHPELVHSHGNQIEQFKQFLPLTRFVGEIGLDHVTPDRADRDLQLRTFEKILTWCSEAGDKVLTIHSRRSAADVIAAIGKNFRGTVILHWYSGTLRDLRKGLESGLYFSVNPAMVYSEQGARIVREIPRDRLLTETDGPFVKSAGVVATPSCVKSVCIELAEMWRVSANEVEDTVRRNFFRAISLGNAS